MPELPEVEITRRGIVPHLVGHRVDRVIVREPRLRWPVSASLGDLFVGQRIQTVRRRAKYLLLGTSAGTVIIHLGMSGSLRVLPVDSPPLKHDHVDIGIESRLILRYRDPRRFGAILWTTGLPESHPLLVRLGPEPLSDRFNGAHLASRGRGRRCTIKSLLMDGHTVVGVGNIYASEALFRAGIDPRHLAGEITDAQYGQLVVSIREVLAEAIDAGGTTLRDFMREDGRPGYFRQKLNVYGRTGEPCPVCGTLIRNVALAQRNTFYCPVCQR